MFGIANQTFGYFFNVFCIIFTKKKIRLTAKKDMWYNMEKIKYYCAFLTVVPTDSITGMLNFQVYWC